MLINGIEYHFILASDIVRDGMYLEVNKANTNPSIHVAEVFYSDVDHHFYLTTFIDNVPMELIEVLIEKAKKTLPPKSFQRVDK